MADADLVAELARLGVTDVATDTATLAAHSSDASLYRVVPRVVVRPRASDELEAIIEVARAVEVPITMRGAGTSIAGNAVGGGIVVDTSRHLNRIVEIDPAARTARVEPGVVHASLQAAVAPLGLRFGPDPSSHTRCTIGGMIGNDACGSRALGYGRTSHNVEALDLITGAGERLTVGRSPAPFQLGADRIATRLRDLTAGSADLLRTELGRFGRQISGYALHHLLPENGLDLTGALVGSEGTLAVVTEATVRLVTEPTHRLLVVLGFADFATAGDAVTTVLDHRPVACEGMDRRIVDVVRARRGPTAVPNLPRGDAWLFVELADDDGVALLARGHRLAAAIDTVDARVVPDPTEAAVLWRIREDGAGHSGRAPSGRPAWAGWEDAAVPPAVLGPYLRDVEELLVAHGLTTMPYGHFGEGCVHSRIDFDLGDTGAPARLRSFLDDAVDLVVGYGGSLSGEHGDGRARSEYLSAMYSPAMLDLFASVKHVFDPEGILNPGVIVDPYPVDTDLRRPFATLESRRGFTYPDDDGDLVEALHRCTGIGRCRSVVQGPGVVMCPSYAATGEELHSTRGRARVLQEMLQDGPVDSGWGDPAVREALDLCLACKGCLSDCPTSVDMATYKAEALHQQYRGRLRPRSHYTLGWLPRWSRLAGIAPGWVNLLLGLPGLRRIIARLAGVDPRRRLPRFAPRSARRLLRRGGPGRGDRVGVGRPVVIFLDSFTDSFAPQVAVDVVTVLREAGYAPRLTGPDVCCGLTWLSTGQLDAARRRMSHAVDALLPEVEAGVPIIGIEPSCVAAMRHDAVGLLGTPAARRVGAAVRTLAELLAEDPEWSPPDLAGTEIVAQPHCHHHAVMGWNLDRQILDAAGATIHQVGGCCGLAGNFGMEPGHYEVSVAVADQQLLPALSAHPDAIYLADGFSCRTQAVDLVGRRGWHLATLLRDAEDRGRRRASHI